MELTNTKGTMLSLLGANALDSFAVLVGFGGQESLITSPNVDTETYFDIASMGKVLITSTLILKAAGEGKLALSSPLTEFFTRVPEEKRGITVQQLLTHTSGIVRKVFSPEVYAQNNDDIAFRILSEKLYFAPGTDYLYSCSGYMLLGFILEKVYGRTLDELFFTKIKQPLGLTRSRFNISVNEPNSALCCRRENVGLSVLDDEIVVNMRSGVAGNGGSFWGLCDIKKYVSAGLGKDENLYPRRFFELAEKNYTPYFSEGSGLGYLVVNEKYPQTGKLFPAGSFGHCGHTGQSFFINRKLGLYVIILTNATRFAYIQTGGAGYYDRIMKMREQIHNAIKTDLDAYTQGK